jgi:hypothetical protein
MATDIQKPNLDELTQVIDSENENNNNEIQNIAESEGYDLTEVYNDGAKIEAPSGGKSFVDQMMFDYLKRKEEVNAIKDNYQEGNIGMIEALGVSAVKKAMLVPDLVGNSILSVLDFGYKNAVVKPAAVLDTGFTWLMPEKAKAMNDAYDGFSQATGDKLANWWGNSQAAQDGVKAATESWKKYTAWGDANPNDKRLLEAVIDIPLFFWPAGKAVVTGVTAGKTSVFTPIAKTLDNKNVQNVLDQPGRSAKNQKRLAGLQTDRQTYDELYAMLNFGKSPINKDNQRRVTSEGFFSQRTTINYNQYEKEYMDTLLATGVSGYKNPTKNNAIISDALETEAKSLLKILQKKSNQVPIPWASTRKTIRAELDKLKLNPMYQGKQQQEAIESQLALLYRILDDEGFKGTPEGLIKLRQAFDNMNLNYKSGASFDGTLPINALDDSTRVIRQTLNKIVGDRIPTGNVSSSLKKQTYMYNGLDDILPALKEDGWSAIQRSWKNVAGAIGLKMDFNRIMAVAFGASAYGMASMGVAAVGVGATVMAGVGVGVAVQTVTTKRALGMLLTQIDKAIKVGKNPNVVQALSYDRATIKKLFDRKIQKDDEGV